MSVRKIRCAVLAALLVPAVTLTWAAAPAEAGVQAWPRDLGGVPTAVHFSQPPVGGEDYTILNDAKRLIDSSRSGDVVAMAIHSISWQAMAESMVAALNRGVAIWAVAPADKRINPATGQLYGAVQYLDAYFKNASGSRIKWCPNNVSGEGGCITNNGTMHSKFITLSAANDPSGTRRGEVSWISSANFTGSSGTKDFNNAVTLYGDSALRAKLNEVWNHMWTGTAYRGTNYYDAGLGRGYVAAPSGQLHVSPEADSDLIASALSLINGQSTACRVRVVHAQISDRPAVVDQLRRLASQRCVVQVVVNSISQAMLDRLRSTSLAGSPVTDIRRATYGDLHDKYVVFYDGGGMYRVITGSQNLTGRGNYFNDEVMFRSAVSQAVHDEYYWHFSTVRGRSTAV
jgi:hypothetical protein